MVLHIDPNAQHMQAKKIIKKGINGALARVEMLVPPMRIRLPAMLIAIPIHPANPIPEFPLSSFSNRTNQTGSIATRMAVTPVGT